MGRFGPGRLKGSAATLVCAEVAAELPALLDEDRTAPHRLSSHVDTCLRCQAELARYRRLRRHLRQLRSAEIELPPGIVSDVLAAIEQAAKRSALRSALAGRRVAWGAVVALALAGAAASMLAGLSQGRGRRGEALAEPSRSPAP